MRTRLGHGADASAIGEGTRVIVIDMLETITKKWVTCMIRWVISAEKLKETRNEARNEK